MLSSNYETLCAVPVGNASGSANNKTSPRWAKKGHCLMLALAMACAGVLSGGDLAAQDGPPLVPVTRPPMGWSSWNSFSNTVDAQITMDQARAMVSSGMQKVGYEYVNIDEGWWLGTRDSQGNIVVDAKAWPALAPGEHPGDMSNIVRFIHGLGLKAGIYTDAGESGCSMFPDLGPKYFHSGSEGHYEQDFLQFAKWGFDFVKVDWCGGNQENLDPAVQYAEIGRAILRAEAITGHRLFYSICDWGKNSPWSWAPGIGGVPAAIWRTSGDIVAPVVAGHEHADRKASFAGMLSNFDQGIHPEAQHTGYYNDPDMMVLGMPGLTDAQNRVHMSLWAISGAPLLVGADLAKLSPAVLALLTQSSVIAVDQDPAALQAVKIAEPATGLQVWSKPLAEPGGRAVLLLNRTSSDQSIAVQWTDLHLQSSAPRITDAWSREQLMGTDAAYETTIPAGDAKMLLVAGTEGPMRHYKPLPVQGTTAGAQLGAVLRQHPVRFENVEGRGEMTRIQIVYTNPDQVVRYAKLRVNGQIATIIAFPPSGKNGPGMVWIQARLDRKGAENLLDFSADCDPGPVVDSISLQ
jgi:Alpha galactosidase A/Alpha galactosidase C-terminal beta sandwich domain